MDKKTRVFNAIDGRPVDRAPFCFWKHMTPGATYGMACVEEHVKLYREGGIDLVKMMIDGYRDVSGGVKIDTPSDWRRIRPPRADSRFIAEQLERIERFIQAIHGEAPVFYHSFTPFSAMRMTWGHDVVFAHLKDEQSRPDLLYALEQLTGRFQEFIGIFLTRTQASGMMLTLSGAEHNGLGAQQHREWIAPSDARVIAAANAHSDYTMLHMCGFGGRPNRLELWRDYRAALATVDLFEDAVSVERARAQFPNIRAFMSGFDVKPDALLMTGSREQIMARARECARSGGTGHIVGAANTMPTALPNGHIRWVGEALTQEQGSEAGGQYDG